MKSITKAQVSVETVSAMTAAAFPDCGEFQIRELTQGMFNAAYHITGKGLPQQGIILKIGPARGTRLLTYEKEILRTEVAVYRMLEKTQVPVPKVLHADYTGSLLSSDFFFMTCVPGILWKDADPETLARCRPQLMEQLGRIHAQIHGVQGGWFGYIKEEERFRFTSWYEAFYAMMSDVCADGIAAGEKLPFDDILALVRRHKEALDLVTTPRLVDFDMWAGNVLLEEMDDGYRISGIIDFERSFFGDPSADFISSVMIFDDVAREADFLRGYGAAAPDSSAELRMNLYRLYLLVIMYVETYRYDEAYAEQAKQEFMPHIHALIKKL